MNELQSLNLDELLIKLPARKRDAHKGNFGHVLVIGGDYGYPGAPVLAALGALRVGAGLVTVASHKDHILGLNAIHPEIMATAIDSPTSLNTLLSKATVVVLGPGLGRSNWSEEIFQAAINCTQPLVLDADSLWFLAKNLKPRTNWVITPHPGEAATLLQQTSAIIPEQRIPAIKKLIEVTKATVVLKGAGTLIGSSDTEINICLAGNPGMASGGMGDLLSGIIAGMLAQNLDCDNAAKLAVAIHAKAGDQAAADGQRGMLATDLLPIIRKLME